MWNLPIPDNKTKTWYLNALSNKTKKKFEKLDINIQSIFKSVLLPGGSLNVIDDLLTTEPIASISLCNSKMDELMRGLERGSYINDELIIYRKAKGKKEDKRDGEEKRVYDKYNDVLNSLKTIFNYKEFISGDPDFSYELSKKKQAKTCTYCGREYIFTVEELSVDDQMEQTEQIEQIARPDFDHWMSHELYPMLALNYCNLIPCCPICNRSIRGTRLMNIDEHIHPYINDKEPGFRFSYKLLDISKPQGEVMIVDDVDPKEKATIDMFQLRALYRYHSETELDDLLRIGLKNGIQYVEGYLMSIMSGMDLSLGNAYRSIFGGELYENTSEERPLSKFKRDILAELGILDLFKF